GQIIEQMSWNSTSTLQKLGMSAMLHDIALDREELAQISDLTDDSYLLLPTEDKKLVLNHPNEANSMIREIKNFIPDVGDIVLSHHEDPEGTGFPRGLSALRITQLSCVFIISEDFVNQIYLKTHTKESLKEMMESFKDRYSRGNFRKPVEGIIELIEKKIDEF
ncbi:MAG: HD domain-containing protein, partial [Oligoflexia bacterium]|nr:HD domain-containing protein [Oligoflexia bacterium]